jgi:NDP-sugar pyrophosphorylase family protein
MAGSGQRFVQKGYVAPKPLIKVNGRMIIEYILDSFDRENDKFIFIVNIEHLINHDIERVLKSLVKFAQVVVISNHKKGPVYTTQKAFQFIDDNEEVIVSYCDNPYIWDYEKFKVFLKEEKPDGCVISHSGFHPHSLNSTKMAFMRLDDNNDLVTEIKEKECYTENHLEEHASTGTYYFRKGSYVKRYFQTLMDRDINYNGEYYVTLVYNLLIADGLNVLPYDTPYVTVFGTPEEVQSFEAWATILKSGQVKDIEDLIKCYLYWQNYHGTISRKTIRN